MLELMLFCLLAGDATSGRSSKGREVQLTLVKNTVHGLAWVNHPPLILHTLSSRACVNFRDKRVSVGT